MVFKFKDGQGMKTIVKVKLLRQSATVEFDIFFARIPNDQQSMDVTANWKPLNFNNEGVFYTDSNALAMVKRISDYSMN